MCLIVKNILKELYADLIKLDDMRVKIAQNISTLENNYERAYEYEKELLKDAYPVTEHVGRELYKYRNVAFIFEGKDYYFHNVKQYDIGENAALSEDDYALIQGLHIEYCIFENCNFHNVVFKNCSFAGTKFDSCKFERVVFERCFFDIPVLELNGNIENDTYSAPTIFNKCFLTADFRECRMEHVLVKKGCFTSSKLSGLSLRDSVMDTCTLYGLELKDCSLEAFAVDHTDIMRISFADERSSTVDENTMICYDLKAKKKDSGKRTDSGWIFEDYDDLCLDKARSLRNISRLFAANGYPDYEGEYYYQSKKMELKGLHGFKRAKSVIALVLCGYGERPSFTFYTILISTLLFGIIYMFTGVSIGEGDPIHYPISEGLSFGKVLADYGRCVFFSITTFSTVGYGNYVPDGPASMIVAGLHMFIGVSLCALWTGCIFRKFAR